MGNGEACPVGEGGRDQTKKAPQGGIRLVRLCENADCDRNGKQKGGEYDRMRDAVVHSMVVNAYTVL